MSTQAVMNATILEDLAVIAVTGDDASQFLQSQLTQDMDAAGPAKAVLAGYCTARGRLLATMIVLPVSADPAEGWLLLVKKDLAQALMQRLGMFVLRSKVTIALTEQTVAAVPARADDEDGTASGPAACPPGTTQPYTIVREPSEGIWISAPTASSQAQQRWWLLPHGDTRIPSSAPGQQAWQAADIAAGLPWVVAGTQELFIPQTLNLDLIDGLSFTKGCYPGQEVVARSHYRGTVRRRMAYARGATNPQATPGTDIFDALQPANPCGRIINAANDDDGLHVLMEVQLADLETADFRLETAEGQPLQITPLPYSLTPGD